MATSGTVATTKISVNDTLTSAIAMTGLRPEVVTPQDWKIAKDILYRFLLDLGNRGINLWTIEKHIFGIIPGKSTYTMPNGTIDELNCYYRTVTYANESGGSFSSSSGIAQYAFDTNIDTACVQTSANGWIQFNFGTAVAVTQFGIMAQGDQYYSLVYEGSDNAVDWTTLYTADTAENYPDREWVINEITDPRNFVYCRVRETGGQTLAVRQVMFGFNPIDITISRTSRDQYTNLPSKAQTSRQPTQFWQDRKINAPVLNYWPVPSFMMDQLVTYYHRHIQDIGALTDELEIPLRWQQAILYPLAMNLCLTMPGTDMARMPMLKGLSDESYQHASDEERDNSPIIINTGIGVYTR